MMETQMRKEAKTSFQPSLESKEAFEGKSYQQWQSCLSEKEEGDQMDSSVSTSIDSSQSLSSSTLSSDLMEDASSLSSSSSSSSNGPLYQLSDLMAQLPIKRGLSKYYEGKSQSFASLASVENLEDLAKIENPYRKRIKLGKNSSSSSGCCDSKKFCRPKAAITKKTCYSKGSFASSTINRNANTNLISSFRMQDF